MDTYYQRDTCPTLAFTPFGEIDPRTALTSASPDFEDRIARNQFIDTMKTAATLRCGWTQMAPLFSEYGLDVLAMVEGAGRYDILLLVDGKSFQLFNPTIGDRDPTGDHTYYWGDGPWEVVGVAVSRTIDNPSAHDDNIAALAAAILGVTAFLAFPALVIPPYDGRIIMTSKTAGASGNLHDIRVADHTLRLKWLAGGGWHYRTYPANGLPDDTIDVRWYLDEFDSFSISTKVGLDKLLAPWRDWYPLENVRPYMFVISPHSVTFAAQQNHTPVLLGDSAGFRGGGHTFRTAAPYFPSEHARLYLAYSFPLNQSHLWQNNAIQLGADTSISQGIPDEGETGWALAGPYAYEESDMPLVNGQPLIIPALTAMGAQMSDSRYVVGYEWDSFVVMALLPLDRVWWVLVGTNPTTQTYPFVSIAHATDGQPCTWFHRMSQGFTYEYEVV